MKNSILWIPPCRSGTILNFRMKMFPIFNAALIIVYTKNLAPIQSRSMKCGVCISAFGRPMPLNFRSRVISIIGNRAFINYIPVGIIAGFGKGLYLNLDWVSLINITSQVMPAEYRIKAIPLLISGRKDQKPRALVGICIMNGVTRNG